MKDSFDCCHHQMQSAPANNKTMSLYKKVDRMYGLKSKCRGTTTTTKKEYIVSGFQPC